LNFNELKRPRFGMRVALLDIATIEGAEHHAPDFAGSGGCDACYD
jgi:hypothetical protein